jgi:hypothetical protein
MGMRSGIAKPDIERRDFKAGSGEKLYDKSPKARSK